MENNYIPRIIDKKLNDYLNALGAVWIKGPKWCGKTTTASIKAKSIVKFQDEDKKEEYEKIMTIMPSHILEGDTPRLLDEWQIYPTIWNSVRNKVDERNESGQFILTGSATPIKDNTLHTGTGRIGTLIMRPMSLYESGESNGKISLKELFDNPNININGITSNLSLEDLIFASSRGGWPGSIKIKDKNAQLLIAKEYYKSLCEKDMPSMENMGNNPSRNNIFLKSYARNISTNVSNQTILEDIQANDALFSESTLYTYLNNLKRLYVIEEVEAWCPNIRSKSAIRSTPKKEFVDPSIAVSALGASPTTLINDLNTFGFIFENLCIRDLRIYSDGLDGSVSYYRDRYGLEADAILHLNDGRYALIEVKLGEKYIEEGAKHLLKLQSLIKDYNKKSKQKLNEPTLLIVLTGSTYAYKTEDNVLIIPIGCLKD